MPPSAAETSSLLTDESRRRALLIGIDYYDQFDKTENLSGCVNDVDEVEKALSRTRRIPGDSIRVLRSRIPGESYPQPKAPKGPGRDDVIAAIRNITAQSRQGDLVYLHFSGHGTREATVYGKKSKWDEALCCADGNIIRDVELGILLDEMTEKGLCVLLVLDCCHSGGATRQAKERWAVRERISGLAPKDIPWMGMGTINSDSGQGRPAEKSVHWFWRDRPYHVIAACQPDEYAREIVNEDQIHGLLTYYFLQYLNSEALLSIRTYKQLIQLLQAQCKSRSSNIVQNPVLHGDQEKTIFGLNATSAQQDSFTCTTIVLRVEEQSVVLGHGLAHGVCLDDEYRLTPLITTEEAGHPKVGVQVFRVQDFEAWARPIVRGITVQDHLQFCEAQLTKSANVAFAALDSSWNSHDVVLNNLDRDWKIDPVYPVELRVGRDPGHADFFLHLDHSKVQILDHERVRLPNVPALTLGSTKKLCDTLKHLRRFSHFERLAPEQGRELNKEWKFRVRRVPTTNNAVATYQVSFKSNSSKPLFFALFGLAPDWSISQHIEAEYVRPRTALESFTLEIFIPGLLRETKPKTMTDKLKVIIATQRHDFSHFQLPEIREVWQERNTRVNVRRTFAVENIELTHVINGEGG